MKVTGKEWALVGMFVILSIIFSSKTWIIFLNTLTPIYGFIIYYIIIFICLLLLSAMGLIVFNMEIKSFRQVLGTTLIFFVFFLIFNWESGWITHVVNSSATVSPIFYGSEDGMTYYLVTNYITSNPELARWITFPLIGGLLTLLGVLLINKRPELHP